MPLYKFSALDKSWRRVVGTVEANSADQVYEFLREQKLRPESVRRVRFRNVSNALAKAGSKPLITASLLSLPLLLLARRRRKKDVDDKRTD